jgi:hypothetical protein
MQRQPAKPGHFSLRQSLAVAIAVVLVLLLAGGSTAAASSNAMPDEPLYPVKLATEEVRLTFAISDAQKAQVHTQLAETRATEVEVMAEKGKPDEAAIAAERFAKELEEANLAMAKLESFTAGISVPTAIPEPTATEEPPTATQEQPTATEEPPTATQEQPTATQEQPTATQEQPTATQEQPTVTQEPPTVTQEPPTATQEQPTATQEPPTVTVEPPTTTVEPPTTTVEPPTVTEEQPTTPSDTKRNKWTARSERFKKTLDESTSKSLEALQNAMEKAPPESKAHWQQAIDKIKEQSKEKNKPTPVWPGQPKR